MQEDDGSHRRKNGVVICAARNGGYNAGTTVPDTCRGGRYDQIMAEGDSCVITDIQFFCEDHRPNFIHISRQSDCATDSGGESLSYPSSLQHLSASSIDSISRFSLLAALEIREVEKKEVVTETYRAFFSCHFLSALLSRDSWKSSFIVYKIYISIESASR
ncbi:hypothetical protein AVEN_123759-1 [Araneus ventricosus]|uniref:Uncharacterized protein n=1 Tax=Araneus ventricosus TaxID=182803 RepID=A0A4Y2BMD9_ARAVE|nr:hypothetical protein AVEN_123759-1 [Araneus ventricosus]